MYLTWVVIFIITLSLCALPKENLSEILRTFLPIGAVETTPLAAVVTNLVIKTIKLSDKIKGLEGRKNRLYERVEKLNQEKKKLDLSLIRDGVDISVLSERYASVLSERNSLEEDEKEKIQENKLREMNKRNTDILMEQIKKKKIKNKNGMNDTEYAMNRKLLEKAKTSLAE